MSYGLFEIASGQLDVAAATLDACPLTNSIWDHALGVARSRLALARKDPAQAVTLADGVVEKLRQFGVGQHLPEALLLKGRAHLMQGEQDKAREALEAGRVEAQAMGSRRVLWQVFAALAETEADPQKAAALKAQARESIQFIADHMTREGFKDLFMQLPDVRAAMG